MAGYNINSSPKDDYTLGSSSANEAFENNSSIVMAEKKQISRDLFGLMREHKLDHCGKEFMALGLFDLIDVYSIKEDKTLESVGFGKIQKRAFWKMVKDENLEEMIKVRQNELDAKIAAATEGMKPKEDLNTEGIKRTDERTTISVQLPEGDSILIVAKREDKISDLKRRIEKICPEYNSAFQKLYHPDKPQRPLAENKTVNDTLPTEDARIRLVKVNWGSSALSGANCPHHEYLWPPEDKLQQDFGCKIISTMNDEKDEKTVHSVTYVLEALEEGRLACDGLAVVYSVAKRQYWLLYSEAKLRQKQDMVNEAKRRYKVEFLATGEEDKKEEKRHVEYDITYGPYNGQRQYRINPDLPRGDTLPPFKEGTVIEAREKNEFSGTWKEWIPYYIVKATIFDPFVFANKDTADEPLPYNAPAG